MIALGRAVRGGIWVAAALVAACSVTPPTAPDAEPVPPGSAPQQPAPPGSDPPPDPGSVGGRFSGLSGHRAAGSVAFRIADGVGEIRLGDDFSSTSVPDPHLYLATEPDANRGTRLRIALLRSSGGPQTYAFRLDQGPTYRYVLVWCDRFNVGVGAARLE